MVQGLSCSAACGIFPDRTRVPCVGRWILSHYVTREIPWVLIYFCSLDLSGTERSWLKSPILNMLQFLLESSIVSTLSMLTLCYLVHKYLYFYILIMFSFSFINFTFSSLLILFDLNLTLSDHKVASPGHQCFLSMPSPSANKYTL